MRTITYCNLPPNERTEQNSTVQNRTDLICMDEIHSFICLLQTFVLPCSSTHHDASSSLRFILCAILLYFVCNFVRSFGCVGAVAEALWILCIFSPSPALHTGTVFAFFFFSPNPLSFRNCLFFSF